ncbi:alpha/beta fold hydrolase [Spinactinospora alkalitolerans]
MYEILQGEVPLRYAVLGEPDADRPPVLLVHGFGSNFEANWVRTGWTGALEGAGHRVVGVDLPGHGGSAKPHDPRCYAPDALAGRLADLLDALGIERADAVGYSMGSRLVWQLALTRPGRVRRAVLGGFGPVNAFAGTDLDRLGTGDDSPFGALFGAVAAMPGNDAAALAACARGQAAAPFDPEPAPPGVPLLFVAGERDELASDVESLAAAVPGAELLRVPRRDHRNAVSAQAFKRSADAFLAREHAVSRPS